LLETETTYAALQTEVVVGRERRVAHVYVKAMHTGRVSLGGHFRKNFKLHSRIIKIGTGFHGAGPISR
jgi:hypothetical protein